MNDIAKIVYSIFSTIGFVTWPPFMYQNYYEGGQLSDKANCEEYAINYCSMSFKELKVFFDKVTSWPQLISKLLVTPTCLHDWPRTFFTPKVFLFSIYFGDSSTN